MQKLRITTHTYDLDKHPNYLEFLNRSIVALDAKVAWVKFTKRMAKFLGEQKYNMGYVEEKVLEDGYQNEVHHTVARMASSMADVLW